MEIKPCDDRKMGQMRFVGQRPSVGPALSLPCHARCQGSMVESSKKEDLSL